MTIKNSTNLESIHFLISKSNIFDLLVRLNRDYLQLPLSKRTKRMELIEELTEVHNLLLKAEKEITSLRTLNFNLELVNMQLLHKLKENEPETVDDRIF